MNSKEVARAPEKKQMPIEPIAPELGINYASSPLLEYAYPPINETIVKNITNAIIAVPKLYTQVLHLMNKMNLPPPFGPLRKRPEMPSATSVKVPRKDEVKYYGESQIKGNQEEEEEDDAEYEAKRPNTETAPVFIPFTKTEVPAPSPSTTAAETPAPSTVKITSVEKEDIKSMFIAPAAVRTCLSLQDILKHRISKEEMTQQKAFANYSYGEPSTKLYLRNMVKDVTVDDILKLFGCFFDNDDQAKEQARFLPVMRRSLEIRVMEGRMKGQAFVTFPSVELAREALTTVNGYLLRDKPVVVCFGKQA